VIGNGQYTIRISYGGVTTEYPFSLTKFDWAVVEQVNITTQLSPQYYDDTNLNSNEKLTITATFVDEDGNNLRASPKDLEVELSIQHEDSAPVTEKFSPTEEELRNNQISYQMDYDLGGNYTIIATVENKFVNSDSNFGTIVSEPYEELVNIPPFAVVDIEEGSSSSKTADVRRNTLVHFDASDSKNDGDIVAYEWDFDYDVSSFEFTVDATGVEVTHSYSNTGTYHIACRVKGDVFIVDPDPFNPSAGVQREFNINSDWEVTVYLIAP
jgi:hypothetical protein